MLLCGLRGIALPWRYTFFFLAKIRDKVTERCATRERRATVPSIYGGGTEGLMVFRWTCHLSAGGVPSSELCSAPTSCRALEAGALLNMERERALCLRTSSGRFLRYIGRTFWAEAGGYHGMGNAWRGGWCHTGFCHTYPTAPSPLLLLSSVLYLACFRQWTWKQEDGGLLAETCCRLAPEQLGAAHIRGVTVCCSIVIRTTLARRRQALQRTARRKPYRDVGMLAAGCVTETGYLKKRAGGTRAGDCGAATGTDDSRLLRSSIQGWTAGWEGRRDRRCRRFCLGRTIYARGRRNERKKRTSTFTGYHFCYKFYLLPSW